MSNVLNFVEGSKTVTQSGTFTIPYPEEGRLVLACKDNNGIVSYGRVSGSTVTFEMDHGTFVMTLPAPSTKISGTDVTVTYKFTLDSTHDDVQSLGVNDVADNDNGSPLDLNYTFIRQEQGQSGVDDKLVDAENSITASVDIQVTGTNDLPTIEILQGTDNTLDLREADVSAQGKILLDDIDGDALTLIVTGATFDGEPSQQEMPYTPASDGEPSEPLPPVADTVIHGKYGDILVGADGTYRYNMTTKAPEFPEDGGSQDPIALAQYEAVSKLTAGQKVTESFTIQTSDGTEDSKGNEVFVNKTLSFTIYGQNDAPVIVDSGVSGEVDSIFTNTDFLGFVKGADAETADSALKYVLVNDIGTAYTGKTSGTTTTYTTEYGVVTLQRVVEGDFATAEDFDANAFGYKYKFEPNYEHPVLAALERDEVFTPPFHIEVRDAQGLASDSKYDLGIEIPANVAPFYAEHEIPVDENLIAYFLNGGMNAIDESGDPIDIIEDELGKYISGAYGRLYFDEGVSDKLIYRVNQDIDTSARESFTFVDVSSGEVISLPFNITKTASGDTVVAEGAVFTENLSIGEITLPDTSLIAAGVGRDRFGEDNYLDTPTAAYAGMLTVKGVITLGEESEAASKYVLLDANGVPYEGTSSRYVTEYGTMTISKTATGANYSFTLNKNSEAVKALDHNDSFTLPFKVAAENADGEYSEPRELGITLTGTNDAPILTIVKDFNDVSVNADTNLYDTVATGKIVIDDADAGDHFMNQTLTGSAKLVADVEATEAGSEVPEEGVVLVINGKYGDFTVYTNGDYTYALAEAGEQYEALKALADNAKATETFTLTTTDRFGASNSKDIAFTVTGHNERPEVVAEKEHESDPVGTALNLTYYEAGVGRDKDGEIIEGTPEEENAVYKAVSATGFIAINDVDMGDAWTPILYVGDKRYEGTSLNTESGRFVFTRATVDEQSGFNVTFTPSATNLEKLENYAEGAGFSLDVRFAVKDKAGWESEFTAISLKLEATNQAPTMTINLADGYDSIVHADMVESSEIAVFNLNFEGNGSEGSDLIINDNQIHFGGSINGKFGVLSYVYNDVVRTDQLLYRPAAPDPNAQPDTPAYNLTQLSTKTSAKDIFEITYIDRHGATVDKTIDVTVFGENIAPVVTVNATDESLIAAGVGRTSAGLEHSNENAVYGGDLTAAGTIRVTDADRDDYSFELHDNQYSRQSDLIKPTTSTTSSFTYKFDEGTLVVSKSGTGYNYKFTLDKNSDEVKALDEGQEHYMNFRFVVTDAQGNEATPVYLDFTIVGSNDAPSLSLGKNDFVLSLAGENAAVELDNSVTTSLTIADLDESATHTFSATFGSVKAEEANGITTIEGKYGTLTINNGEEPTMTYTLQGKPNPDTYNDGEDDARYIADLAQYDAIVKLGDAKSATEKFTITVTDDEGATHTQTVTYTVRGGENNYAPEFAEVSPITYGTSNTTNADLKAAGFYDDSNRAYGGDLAATGKLTASDDDKDALTFVVADNSAPAFVDDSAPASAFVVGEAVVKGSTTTYSIGHSDAAEGEVIGTLAITKSNTTTSTYKFTLSKDSDFIKSLVSDETYEKAVAGLGDGEETSLLNKLEIFIPIVAIDSRGGESAAHSIKLTIEGSNDGPQVSFIGETVLDLSSLVDPASAIINSEEEPPVDEEELLSGTTNIVDPDWAGDTPLDWNSGHDYTFSISGGKVAGDTITASGKYGNYVFNSANGLWEYKLGVTDAQEIAAKSIKDGVEVTDKFTLTTTDPDGIKVTKPIELTIIGTNDAPEVIASTATDALIMPGYGRNSSGKVVNDADLAYKGDITSKGTLTVKDYDGDAIQYSIVDKNGDEQNLPSGTIKVDTDFGILTLTKTSAGLTYSLALDPDSDKLVTVDGDDSGISTQVLREVPLRGLTAEETATLDFPITISDGKGGETQQTLSFTVQGTDDGPAIDFTGDTEIDLSPVDSEATPDLAYLSGDTNINKSVSGGTTIVDPDGDFIWDESTEFSLAYGKVQGSENNGIFSLSGTYGNYIFNSADGEWEYHVGFTNAQQIAAKSIKDGEIRTESFTLTVTDIVTGIKTPKPIEFTITGTNDAPEVTSAMQGGSIVVTDALIMSGVGRNTAGLDAHDAASVSANTAYKGDFLAKGSVAVKDYDGDSLTYFVLTNVAPIRVSATATRFETEYGEITITKTTTGFNYSLTLEPDAVFMREGEEVSLRSLAADEKATFEIDVTVDDGKGKLVSVPLSFTVTGTNDAPEISSDSDEQEISLGLVQTGRHNEANVATHDFSVSDAEGDALQMSITLNGKTEYFENISEGFLIEGTYGNVYYDSASSALLYKSGETDAQKLALQKISANKVVQDNFTVTITDDNGGSTSHVFENKLIGSDIPLGEVGLELNVASSNTVIIDDGVGRDSKGNDITVNVNPDMDNTPYMGDFTANGTIAVPVQYRDVSLLLVEGMRLSEGVVAGNTTTFMIRADADYVGSIVFTKTSSGYSYVFTANKNLLNYLSHGEKLDFNPRFILGEKNDEGEFDVSYVTMTVPLTFIGTNDAPIIEVRAIVGEGYDFDLQEAADNDAVSGSLRIYDINRDDIDTLTIIINGEKIAISGEQTIHGEYGDLAFNFYSGEYTYTLGVSGTQKEALKAHDNYDIQHETFEIVATDKLGASTKQDLNFNINRQGAPELDLAEANTHTQDGDLFIYAPEFTAGTAEGSFTIHNPDGVENIEVTGANGIVYDLKALTLEQLNALKIDGEYGTFSKFEIRTDEGNTQRISYTYTQYVDAPHTDDTPLVDTLDVRVLGEGGVLFGEVQFTNSIENLSDSGLSQAFNDALAFTSTDADSLIMSGTLANNRAYAGDMTATGKLTGTAFDVEGVSFEMYDENGAPLHGETHGIYTKFFSDMGIITLTRTATGMNYSIVLDKDYEGFKDLPQDFTTSFPFTLVASKGDIELGREDLGIEVRGTNDGFTVTLGEAMTRYSDYENAGSFIIDDPDMDDTHTFALTFGSKTVHATNDGDGDETTITIAGKYGNMIVDLSSKHYRYTHDNLTSAQQAAFDALERGEEMEETFTLTTTDATGAFVKTPITVVARGENNALTLDNEELEITIPSFIEPAAATRAATGFFTYEDKDGDRPVFFIEGVESKTTGTSTVFELEYGTLTLNTATHGRVSYSFKLNDKALEVQKLAVGEELEFGTTLILSDDKSGDAQSIPFNFTVTGTNDAPTMRHEADFNNMTVHADGESSFGSFGPFSGYEASGSLNINDIDASDHRIITISSTGKDSVNTHDPHYEQMWNDAGELEDVRYGNIYTMEGTYGTLTLTPDGEYTYTLASEYSNNASGMQGAQLEALAKLGDGKSTKESFTVTVEDGNGGKVSQVLTFTVVGTNDAPVVTMQDELFNVYASGIGREEDGSLSENPATVYEDKPVSGRIDVVDYEGGTLTYTLQDPLTGEMLTKPTSFETSYGTFTFKYDTKGVTFTFDVNSEHPNIKSLEEGIFFSLNAYEVPVLDLTVTDSKGASNTVNLFERITIGGSNNIHELEVEYDLSDRLEPMVAPSMISLTASFFVNDPDDDVSLDMYTFTGIAGVDADTDRTEAESGTLTIVGTYGDIAIDTSMLLPSVTYTLRDGVDLSNVPASGTKETFTVYVTDENGVEVAKEMSFTVHKDTGVLPGAVTDVTAEDDILIAAGVGRDENGEAYGQISHGTAEEELTPYVGDLIATGTLVVDGGAPAGFAANITAGITGGVSGDLGLLTSSVKDGVYTITTDVGDLVITPKSGGVYDYVFNLNADSDIIRSLEENPNVKLAVNFNLSAMNEKGFFGSTASLTFNIAGTNDAPTIESRHESDASVIFRPYDNIAQGTFSISDVDMSSGKQESQILTGFSAHTPDIVVGEALVHDPLLDYNGGHGLTIYGEYGVLVVNKINGTYAYEPTTEEHPANSGALPEFIAAHDARYEKGLALAEGEKAVEKFTITTTDNNGAPASMDIEFTVIGTNDVPVVNLMDSDMAVNPHPDMPYPDMSEDPRFELTYIAEGVGRDEHGSTYDDASALEVDNNLAYIAKPATGFIAVSDPEGDAIIPVIYAEDSYGITDVLKGSTKGDVTTFTTVFGKVTFTYTDAKEVPALDDIGNPILDENYEPTTKLTSGFDVSFEPSANYDYLYEGETLTLPLQFGVEDRFGYYDGPYEFDLNIEGSNQAPELVLKSTSDLNVFANTTDDNSVTWQAEIYDAEDWTRYRPTDEHSQTNHPPFVSDMASVNKEFNTTMEVTDEGSNAIYVEGQFGRLVYNPDDNTFTYTVDNGLVEQAATENAEGEAITFPTTESFNITVKDEDGATNTQTITMEVGRNVAPVISEITMPTTPTVDTNLIAAGVGRDTKGGVYEDTTAANENRAYAGDLKSSGVIYVTDADKDTYTPVVNFNDIDFNAIDFNAEDFVLSEPVIKGTTYTYTLIKPGEEGAEDDVLGTLVFTKSGVNFNYALTLNKTSATVIALAEDEELTLPLQVQMQDKYGNMSEAKDLNFTITGSNDAPTLSFDHRDDLTVSLGDENAVGGMGVDSSISSVIDIIDPDDGDSHTFSATFGSGKTLVSAEEEAGIVTIEGKYGTLIIYNGDEGPSMVYSLAEDGPQYEAALALGDKSAPESFTITVTDASGATKSQVVTYSVRGENNFVPVISDIRETNDSLFDDGYGREANGTDSATWNKAYKGDLTATGTILASDGDKDVLSYSIEEDDNVVLFDMDRSTATIKYYDIYEDGERIGTVSLTNKGAYTFTMNAEHPRVNALPHGETMDVDIAFAVNDNRGGLSESKSVIFTIEGSDDGPMLGLQDGSDLTVSDAIDEYRAIGTINITDVDDPTFDRDDYDYTLTFGKVAAEKDGVYLIIQGEYGSLEYNTADGTYRYRLDTGNADYLKLSKGSEVQESFVLSVTDPKGIKGSKELEFTITGGNEAPTVDIKSTTEDEMDYAPNAQYKGNIIIDDLDLDGDTLRELDLSINGVDIDTTKNGTTKIIITGEPVEVSTDDGAMYNMPGEPLGELSVTISGNNCSYVFKPYENAAGLYVDIPITVTDVHDGISSEDASLNFFVKSLYTGTFGPGSATEGGEALVGTFADMSSYANATWADVDVYINPSYNDRSAEMMHSGWQELTLPADVNGMGKPDQYFESDYGTIAFFHKTGKYVFNPAPDSIMEDVTLNFVLNFYGDDAHLFRDDDGSKIFSIYLNNTVAPTLDIFSEGAGTDARLPIYDSFVLDKNLTYSDDVTLGDDDTDDVLTQSIIYDGDVYEPNEHGVIMVEGEYGRVFYYTNDGTYKYLLKSVDDSFVLDPHVREMLALKDGESLEEVFTFSVIDSYNARVEENLTVTINGSDQGPQFVMLTGSKDEATYGTAITGTFTLEDFEDKANVMGEHDLYIGGAKIDGNVTLKIDSTGSVIFSNDPNPLPQVGTLTITKSGNNYKYSYKGDADSDSLNNIITIEARAKEGGMEIIKDLDFDVLQKTVTVSGSKVHTVRESSEAVISGRLTQGAISGRLTADAQTAVLAAGYANGKMSTDSSLWTKVDLSDENAPTTIPDTFANQEDIVTYFTSDAGNLAFYANGNYRFEPSGENSVWEDTEFTFTFDDFAFTGENAANYAVTEPTFTLNIIDDVQGPLESPLMPAALMADESMAGLLDDDAEFVIDNIQSLYTQEIQGGSGNDLVTLDLSLEDIVMDDVLGIDGGEGMDVLLSGIENLDTVKELMEAGKITDMEVIIAGEANGTDADAVRQELGIVDDNNDGILDLENHGWSKTESSTTPQGYAEYKNEDDSMTILVQQTLLGNSQA